MIRSIRTNKRTGVLEFINSSRNTGGKTVDISFYVCWLRLSIVPVMTVIIPAVTWIVHVVTWIVSAVTWIAPALTLIVPVEQERHSSYSLVLR